MDQGSRRARGEQGAAQGRPRSELRNDTGRGASWVRGVTGVVAPGGSHRDDDPRVPGASRVLAALPQGFACTVPRAPPSQLLQQAGTVTPAVHRWGSEGTEKAVTCPRPHGPVSSRAGQGGRSLVSPSPYGAGSGGRDGLPDASEGTGRAPCCPRLPSALRGQKPALSQGADQRAWVPRLELPRERNLPALKSSPLSSILLKSILNGPPDAVGPGA